MATGPSMLAPARAKVVPPKYWELKEHLRDFCDHNRPGTLVPAERRLAEEFGISRVTVRQAIQELVVEGKLSRAHGRGTFVAPPKLTHVIGLTSTADAIRAQGAVPSSRILTVGECPADREVADRLRLAPGTAVVALKRLRLADSECMALDHSYFEAARFPGLVGHLDGTRGLYQVLQEEYGCLPAQAEETIEAAMASPEEAALLEVETGVPMLEVEKLSYDAEGVPMEFSRGLFRGDRYRFLIHL